MASTLKHISLKCFLLLMALQILNLGVDAIDFQPMESSATIGDFNYINSMTEYVSEILMGYKDAFPEYQKESPSSKSQLVKHFSLKFYELNFYTAIRKEFKDDSSYIIPLNEMYNYRFFKEINPPPPKA